MDTSKVRDYITLNFIDPQFTELDAQELEALRALGVPEAEAPLQTGGGEEFTGRACFRWWESPMIIHY